MVEDAVDAEAGSADGAEAGDSFGAEASGANGAEAGQSVATEARSAGAPLTALNLVSSSWS